MNSEPIAAHLNISYECQSLDEMLTILKALKGVKTTAAIMPNIILPGDEDDSLPVAAPTPKHLTERMITKEYKQYTKKGGTLTRECFAEKYSEMIDCASFDSPNQPRLIQLQNELLIEAKRSDPRDCA